MNHKLLLLKYMLHLRHIEESVFLEFINTPFSTIHFEPQEVEALRQMEAMIESGLSKLN